MTTATRPATAWPLENALVSAALAARRVGWIDAPARALGLRPFTRQELTRQILGQVRRTGSGRPTRLRTAFGTFLMPLNRADAAGLVAAAEEAGARGAVTAFTDRGRRLHLTAHAPLPVAAASLSGRVRKAADAEAHRLLAARQGDATLDRDDWNAAARRLARRIVLGAAAADDTLVSDILDATARAADDAELASRRDALSRRLAPYLADIPADGTVVVHALETVTRALTDTAAQALALVSCGRDPEGAVTEALLRYPPLAATVHRVDAPFVWDGTAVDAGTEILCATGWLRDLEEADDPDDADDADGYDSSEGDDDIDDESAAAEDPEDSDELVEDDERDDFDGFSGSAAEAAAALCAAPVPCAAADLAVLAAGALVRALTRDAVPAVLAPRLGPGAPPAELPADTLRLALVNTGADAHVPDDSDLMRTPPAGQSPAHYAALAAASARRLEGHARRLAEFARQPGFNHDAFGERCRMTLLGHAERCARAAADARRAADWLTN
ncbi:hypothetical protein ABT127_21675 [Streptomyces sp. NPDC001904]|uniref:hypothetical protein n=1 Tax=Streptomyces sp. NPDC001904 TaxID=3154531 RepID=UPI0033252A42